MGWNDVVAGVREQLPQFNDYLLMGFRKEQVDSSPEFMDKVFKESVRTIQTRAQLNYLGYRVVRPEEQVEYLLGSPTSKDKINIQRSELQLCEYLFEFEGEQLKVYLFLPYLCRNLIVINDTEYNVLNLIIDKLIVRTTDGVIVKVMKQPINFWRNKHFSFKSVNGDEYRDVLVTTKAFGGRKKTSIDITIVLYLMAEYGFEQAMRKLSVQNVSFTDAVSQDDEEYSYFEVKENIYLKTLTDDMESVSHRRVVAAILYSLKYFTDDIYAAEDVYQCFTYRMILGKCLHGRNYNRLLAEGHCESHLESLRTYLDEITKNRLYSERRIECKNIFDLFVYVFYNIDDWLVSYRPNDLFEKRLGGVDTLLSHMVEMVNNQFYNIMSKNKQLKRQQISKAMRFNVMGISNIYDSPGVRSKPSAYNDNELFSVLIKKERPLTSANANKAKPGNTITSKEHQFSPSMLAIESVWSISSSNPGISGDINPFAVIDENGRFLKDKMPWYKEIESIQKYLVQV